jgi:glycerophosphoryl diester phosphodiesterase
MPDQASAARPGGRLHALLVVCVLAAASTVIAFLGAAPTRVSAGELLGTVRAPGEPAFVAAHRGGAVEAPENTLPAIQGALAGGFDYVEVDVALTRDRAAVLMHDATVDRTTDGHGPVAALTLAQVRALDAGGWFDQRFAGTRVPTLVEFLDVLAQSGKRALVELKGVWDAAAVRAFVDDVSARGLERHVAVSSFDARTLAEVARASSVLSRLAIFKRLPADLPAAARELGVSGVVADGTAVHKRPDIIDALHAEGMRIVLYTLNDDAEWATATQLGVDGIITDAPHSLEKWQTAALRDSR